MKGHCRSTVEKSVNISLSKVMYKCAEEMLRYVTSHTP